MYENEFERFEEFSQIDDLQNTIRMGFIGYVSTIIRYKHSKEDLMQIFEQYKNNLIGMIQNSQEQKEQIMTDEKSFVRHDKDFEQLVNFAKITRDIFHRNEGLSYFENRARTVLILEVAKLINCYGMERLRNDYDKISQEIRLGIFTAREDLFTTPEELKKIEQRAEIDNTFGEEAIPYLENYELLQARIASLRKFTNDPEEIEQLEKLMQGIEATQRMIDNKDRGMLPLLMQCYRDYEQINRSMIVSRLDTSEGNITEPSECNSLLLLHFIPDFSQHSDSTQEDYLSDFATEYIRSYIESKYGREYDPEIDREETREMFASFLDSKNDPTSMKSRFPIKNRYVNDMLKDIITQPHTNLSCSIGMAGALSPHLDRKVAIGFTIVPIEAIRTINKGYNNGLDIFSFEKNSVPVSEVVEFIQMGGTNETLVDWTQVEPSYILLVKDTDELDENLTERAQELREYSGLPIRIYDANEIERRKEKQRDDDSYDEIEGAYSALDLRPFARILPRGKRNIIERIKSCLDIGGKRHEDSI